MENFDKDMKHFDIDKLSRKMPYKLNEDFFDTFPEQMMAKINREKIEDERGKELAREICSRSFPRYLTIALSAAAMVAVVMILSFDFGGAKEPNESMAKEGNVREFVAQLSDEDLSLLISDTDRSYEFYTNM